MESEEKIPAKLDESEDGRDTDAAPLVARAIQYLKSHPLDNAGCAKELGLSYYLYRKLREEHHEEFDNEDQRFYAELEKLVALSALGRELPPGYEGFEFNKAMKVLERRKRDWAATQKLLPPKEEKPDMSYKDMLKEHLEKEFGTAKTIRSGSA